ncbi:hypothetical protein CBR_g39369 [Chara braunii]|uniref:Fatty acid hydroxylase domain-containing protein n=1 Tax=Chara braunii TaxID=69332 RepID=A0A388LRE4_CHABU|nr:hypothetical protein CBR_g39369 [Chara braunii]|eukprot:GBG84908.1 hypothetical protein CBR_g39369 [Chara braunii]
MESKPPAGMTLAAPWRPYLSDEMAAVIMPLVVYWLYSGLYHLVEVLVPSGVKAYRLHTWDESSKNLTSVPKVVGGVLLQQALQAGVAVALFVFDDSTQRSQPEPDTWVQIGQLLVAMFIMDTWQYFCHRWMHVNKFMYRHFHSVHHRLTAPIAFGALYNHPVEGLLMDTVGGALSFLLSGMSTRLAVLFYCFATMKTVDDHCGLWLPLNPFQKLFSNNSAYHDIHHQLHGGKYNFSQPFFVFWDRILGTYMEVKVLRREEDGCLQAAPAVCRVSAYLPGVELKRRQERKRSRFCVGLFSTSSG